MTLCKGDHVVIKRNEQVITDGELYREYEVLNNPCYENVENGEVEVLVRLRKVV